MMFKRWCWLAVLVLWASTTLAQTDSGLIYSAILDTDGNGRIEDADAERLMRATLTGSIRELPLAGDRILQVAVSADETTLAATYLSEDASTTLLTVFELATERPITELQVPDLTDVQVYFLGGDLWIVGEDAADRSVIRGYTLPDGALIAERAAPRPNTRVMPDPAGNYFLIFHEATFALSVYSVPALRAERFEVSGLGAIAPDWSPRGHAFLIGSRAVADPLDLAVLIVDMAAGETRTLDTPDFDAETLVFMDWSSGGRYVVLQAVGEETTFVLVDAATGELFQLGFEDLTALLAWSRDDRFVAYRDERPDETTGLSSIVVLDTENRTTIPLSAYAVSSVFWSQQSSQMVFLGRNENDGRSGLYIVGGLDTGTATVREVFSSADPNLASGAVFWFEAQELLAVVSRVNSGLQTAAGLPRAIFIYSTQPDGVSRALSSSAATVNPEQIIPLGAN